MANAALTRLLRQPPNSVVFSSIRRTGEEFADEDVVACYVQRPPYPAALVDRLCALSNVHGHVLDLGCGPGKLAIALAPHFGEVTAVDPSSAMLALAQRLGEAHSNIHWIHGRAEEAELYGPFDLAVAGAAIHWMQPEIVMPKLAAELAPGAHLALADGDAPIDAPWIDEYRAHVIAWVEKGGATWRDPATTRPDHLNWLDVVGEESFEAETRQTIDGLLQAEHSRATWSRATMGSDAAAQFDAGLRALLTPHAADGWIAYRIRTRLIFGRPRLESSLWH